MQGILILSEKNVWTLNPLLDGLNEDSGNCFKNAEESFSHPRMTPKALPKELLGAR